MGGNARAIDRETGRVKSWNGRAAAADRIGLRGIDRAGFREDFIKAMHSLAPTNSSRDFIPFWDYDNHFDLLWGGRAFSGSSRHLFDPDVTDETLLRVKPVFGDIDIMVPREKLSVVWDTLVSCEGEFVTNEFAYVGQNKQRQSGHQINAIFEYSRPATPIFVQVDFEGVDFGPDGFPTEFSRFSHSSSLADLSVGLKGVAHKYLITNLFRVISHVPDAVVLTDKSPEVAEFARVRQGLDSVPQLRSFSVDRGLRTKLRKIIDSETGEPLTVDGRLAYKELPTSESVYTTDLRTIFEELFSEAPAGQDMGEFWSFMGLLELCARFLPREDIAGAYRTMIQKNLFGRGSQNLFRDDLAKDEALKRAITKVMQARFPYLAKYDSDVSDLKTQYYTDVRKKQDARHIAT